jgi:branched-chain amino acid transport system substrate-binding protein
MKGAIHMNSRTRRTLALLAALAPVIAGAPSARAQQGAPLKLGLMIPVTGVFAAPGKYMQEGLELYLRQHNNSLGGRPVQVVVADTQGNPQVGVTKVRELVEQDHVDVLFGELSAAVGVALVPYINAHRVPTIYPIVSADDLTQRTPSFYIARTGWTSSEPTQVLGDYAYKVLHYKKVATIAYDFNFGWESIGGFVASFQADGGKVSKQIWTPLVTSDYSPFLSALPRDVDAVMCSFSGSAAINFIRQYRQFGLTMPLICQGNTTDESTLADTGPSAAGIITALQYSAVLATPENTAFVKAYKGAFGHEPSYYGEATYTGAEFLDKGLQAAHGTISDPIAFIKLVRAIKAPNAPRGPVALDGYGAPVQNIYIRKVVQQGASIENAIVRTYPAVTQFWTFDHANFLAHPVYSRSYPPCNACSG